MKDKEKGGKEKSRKRRDKDKRNPGSSSALGKQNNRKLSKEI